MRIVRSLIDRLGRWWHRTFGGDDRVVDMSDVHETLVVTLKEDRPD